MYIQNQEKLANSQKLVYTILNIMEKFKRVIIDHTENKGKKKENKRTVINLKIKNNGSVVHLD